MAADQSAVGVPTWFGPGQAPLFGVVHVPAGGTARAGIVICPPLGKEHVDSYRGVKLLAQQLCAAGFAVLRFDYAGTGDSTRDQREVTTVDDYLTSIHAAVTYLRDSGARSVGIVGLRMGALLAAAALPSLPGVASLVLWDPVTDARRYLREQRALYKMTVGDDVVDVDGESIIGISFSTVAAKTLKAVTLPATLDPTLPLLVAARPELMDDPRLVAVAAAPNCTVREIAGQVEYVQPITFVVDIPVATLDVITAWLDGHMPTGDDAIAPVIRRAATVARSGGRDVVETITHLGPNALFAIRTAPADAAAQAPTLLIHNTACEHRVGPGRIWTECARELAARGFSVIRYDRRGTGETGLATTEFPRIYSAMSKEDVLDAIGASGAAPERLMMTGVCSGAWNSAYGALRRGARSVVLVNAILYSLRRVELGPEKLIGLTPAVPGDAPAPEPRGPRAIVKRIVRRWLPHPAWLLLGRLGVTQVPEVLLKALRQQGVSVDLVLSPEDHTWFEKQRGPKAVARLARVGWSQTVVPTPTGDHSLLQRDVQNFTRRYLALVAERDFADVLPGIPCETAGERGRDEPECCSDAISLRGT